MRSDDEFIQRNDMGGSKNRTPLTPRLTNGDTFWFPPPNLAFNCMKQPDSKDIQLNARFGGWACAARGADVQNYSRPRSLSVSLASPPAGPSQEAFLTSNTDVMVFPGPGRPPTVNGVNAHPMSQATDSGVILHVLLSLLITEPLS